MRDPVETRTVGKPGDPMRRKVYRGDDGTIVIRNPEDIDRGTAFRPRDPKKYFDEFK
jgi:hypothetical protein